MQVVAVLDAHNAEAPESPPESSSESPSSAESRFESQPRGETRLAAAPGSDAMSHSPGSLLDASTHSPKSIRFLIVSPLWTPCRRRLGGNTAASQKSSSSRVSGSVSPALSLPDASSKHSGPEVGHVAERSVLDRTELASVRWRRLGVIARCAHSDALFCEVTARLSSSATPPSSRGVLSSSQEGRLLSPSHMMASATLRQRRRSAQRVSATCCAAEKCVASTRRRKALRRERRGRRIAANRSRFASHTTRSMTSRNRSASPRHSSTSRSVQTKDFESKAPRCSVSIWPSKTHKTSSSARLSGSSAESLVHVDAAEANIARGIGLRGST
mmetsp:Transcript_83541/g.233136  ORF Transcript_83541/g.233136 Transcript_83541/m.233136 type:complete len:329 (+) Transcript_83541:1725-2711(+)